MDTGFSTATKSLYQSFWQSVKTQHVLIGVALLELAASNDTEIDLQVRKYV
ncbi:hypothetical protein THOD03_130103 [Vibrio harveyi]|nr:hypothetical protein TH15OA1_250046 [Vibrio harveyi]CAH1549930.1 hypothetical protein THOD03_130103 [Vibrio harveyi]